MPIIKSAKKKLRQDKKRRQRNLKDINDYKEAVKAVKKEKDLKKLEELVRKAYTKLDKAAKKKIIHKNKAARLKRLVITILNKTKKGVKKLKKNLASKNKNNTKK